MRLGIVLACALTALSAFAQSTVLYQTSFETSEGYNQDLDLAFQNGWEIEGSGGNGLIASFPGMGQQAYIGYTAPTNSADDFTALWRPLVSPAPANTKAVRFSTVLQLVGSTGGGDDEFRWTVYNADTTRLFSISFDMASKAISYILQDRIYHDTGFVFDLEGTYDLVIWMNFEKNTWSALLNDQFVVNSEKIADSAADLSFGDVDAVWVISNITGVGNNFMMFDDYRITAEALAAIPSFIEPVGIDNTGAFTFNIYAEKGHTYSVDVSTDLLQWFSLGTYANPNGSIFFRDVTSKNFPAGFYRVRQID